MKRKQSINTKKAETTFRRRLVRHHLGEDVGMSDEYTFDEIMVILKHRVNMVDQIFGNLKNKGIKLSPFLEIGSERSQCSMVLKNFYHANGVSIDISWDMLKFANVILHPLGFQEMPGRCCCDAYNLPFRDGSFSFVFCLETLHHFPDPTPVILEIKRVLKRGGFFLLMKEPVKRRLKVSLWVIGHKLNRIERILQRLRVLEFITESGKIERKCGVLEERFEFKKWLNALNVFHIVSISVKTLGRLSWSLSEINKSSLKRVYLNLLGGAIRALCQK